MNRKNLLALVVVFTFLTSVNLVFAAKPDNPPGLDNQSLEAPGLNKNDDEEEDGVKGKGKGSVIIQSKGNKLKITEVEDEDGDEFEIEDEEEQESTESAEFDTDPDDDNSLEIKAHGNAALVISNKLAAQTNFPLRVNLDTNELIVNTPKGAKIVTVLPDAAVANMLAANVLDQIGGKGGLLWLAENPSPTPIATPSATPTATVSATPTSSEPTATPSGEPSATPSAEPSVEPGSLEALPIQLVLTDDGILAYEIEGSKLEKLLGLFEVELDRIVVVSAETGELIEIDQNFLTRLLDLVSF